MSGLFFNEDITWVTFHGQYDFAYLFKLLSGEMLPENYNEFRDKMENMFPKCYDIKQIISENEDIKNFSLQKLGIEYLCKREGEQHQAGSDALLTLGNDLNRSFL